MEMVRMVWSKPWFVALWYGGFLLITSIFFGGISLAALIGATVVAAIAFIAQFVGSRFTASGRGPL